MLSPLASIISPLLSVLNGRVNKAHRRTAGDKPSSLLAVSDGSPSSSIRPVTPELWQHSPVDLLFHETPSCSLLSCNQISLLGSGQEEEYCLCGLSPLSSSCVSSAEVRWERSTFQVLTWPRATKKELSVTGADKGCHCYSLLSNYAMYTARINCVVLIFVDFLGCLYGCLWNFCSHRQKDCTQWWHCQNRSAKYAVESGNEEEVRGHSILSHTPLRSMESDCSI